MSPPVRVLYIAGTGRSGSTLVGNILGEAEGLFSAGEVRYIWQRGLVENRLCGCGAHFAECAFWRQVCAVAFGDRRPDVGALSELQARMTRIRRLPVTLLRRSQPNDRLVREYLKHLAAVYGAVAAVSGGDTIVDSSKLPSYAWLLASLPNLDLRVLHLVRDPRAAAFSWSRSKPQPDRGYEGFMETQTAPHSTALWTVWNAMTASVLSRAANRYARVRYEDFTDNPEGSLREALRALDLGEPELPFETANVVRMGPNHTIAGNPDRLRHGMVTVLTDSAWRSGLPARDRRLVTALSWPLLLRWGYPLLGRNRVAAIGIQQLPPLARAMRRLERHWRWARNEGFRRLVEEDELNPADRVARVVRRREWQRRHPIPRGSAIPVYLVGLQRSGTNMLARGLEASPEFQVHNERDRRAFERFQLRPDPVLRQLVARSRQRFVLFKPLIDSHRVDQLLDGLGSSSPARALWCYRGVDGRVRSAISKFGDNNLQVLRSIALGVREHWQAQRLSAETLDLIKSFDYDRVSAESAAALMWYVRNSLYFELHLDRRNDVLLVAYDRLLRTPDAEIRRVCTFLGAEYSSAMAAHIQASRARTERPLDLDPSIRALCAGLEERLAAAGSVGSVA